MSVFRSCKLISSLGLILFAYQVHTDCEPEIYISLKDDSTGAIEKACEVVDSVLEQTMWNMTKKA